MREAIKGRDSRFGIKQLEAFKNFIQNPGKPENSVVEDIFGEVLFLTRPKGDK